MSTQTQTQYRIVEETRGEVTMTENYDELVDAANSMLINCGGEAGMPGDTVEELVDYVERHGGLTVNPFPGCVWRLLVIEEDARARGDRVREQVDKENRTLTVEVVTVDDLEVGDLWRKAYGDTAFSEILAVRRESRSGVRYAIIEYSTMIGRGEGHHRLGMLAERKPRG